MTNFGHNTHNMTDWHQCHCQWQHCDNCSQDQDLGPTAGLNQLFWCLGVWTNKNGILTQNAVYWHSIQTILKIKLVKIKTHVPETIDIICVECGCMKKQKLKLCFAPIWCISRWQQIVSKLLLFSFLLCKVFAWFWLITDSISKHFVILSTETLSNNDKFKY